VDHREIVTAIRLRNPDDARNMMDHHLRGLTQDFNRYVSR
jgi:DNA-binding FadR family transcriptional regulator